MATPKAYFHTRSISLPFTSHPVDASIKDHLHRLSTSPAGPSNSSSICQNLSGIKDLYEQMNEMIHLPHNRSLLSESLHRGGGVEQVLDGSLALVDASSSAMAALFQMKESILDLQSALLRGNDDEGINVYLMSRKKISKAVSKCFANLKKMEKSLTLAMPENEAITVKMLKEAQVISLSTLKSVLSYLTGKKVMSQTRGWSLVVKLIKSKNESHDITEVEEIDHALSALSEKHSGAETKTVLKPLETLEFAIHELADGIVSVSRCFVKTRVSLLNVLNH